MPAQPRTSREQWIETGLRTLAIGGPEAVRVEVLAGMLGVTKGGFYGQFADRDAFLDEVLDAWERRSVDAVLAQVDGDERDDSSDDGRSAPDRIRRAGALTFSDELLPVDLAVRAWARSNPAVARRLRRVDNRRIDYLRRQFATFVDAPAEVEARAMLTFALAIGQHFMAADHGDRTHREAVALAVAFLVDDDRTP